METHFYKPELLIYNIQVLRAQLDISWFETDVHMGDFILDNSHESYESYKCTFVILYLQMTKIPIITIADMIRGVHMTPGSNSEISSLTVSASAAIC